MPLGNLGQLVGTIRHRLLINRLVDPAEVAPRLPGNVRPYVTSTGGVVVGCCLIAIGSARPWPAPSFVGPTIRAAAHRISVEAGPPGSPTSAVYVPMRHSDSVPTVTIGGRLFPGVHQRSEIDVTYADEFVSWNVRGRGGDADDGFGISAQASRVGAKPASSEVAEVVIGTYLGISPNHRGQLEGAQMRPADLAAEEVELTHLASDFLDSFSTAEKAPTLLMTEVDVTWSRAALPF